MLAAVGSTGIIIAAALLLLRNRSLSEIDYSTVIKTLNRDFKIGLSQVKKIEDLKVKEDLILKGEDDLNQETYYQVLNTLVDDQFLHQLFHKITDTEVETKKRAARTLLKIGTPQAVDYAVPLLYDEAEEVKTLVINKLAELQQRKVVSVLVNYLDYCNNVLIKENLVEAFRTLGAKSVPKLLDLVKQGGKHRNWIIKLLGDIGGEEIIDSLLEILENSPPENVRINTLKSLSQFPEQPKVFSTLVNKVTDNSCNVRAQVAKLLRKFDREEVYSHLYELLKDSSGIVRQNAAKSLLQLGREGIKYLVLAVEEGVTSREVTNCLKQTDPVKLISLVKEEYQGQIQSEDAATLEIVDETGENQKLIG